MSLERRRLLTGAALGLAGLTAGATGWSQAGQAARPKPAQRVLPGSQPPRIVAIDAGHGGRDPGAIGVHGTYEKLITIAVATQLARQLDAKRHYKPVLTRDRDRFVALDDRVERARDAQATLFVSLHADSVPRTDARGFSIYTLSEQASDAMTAALAQRENAVDRLIGAEFRQHSKPVRTILLDLMHRETSNNAALMANAVLESFAPPAQPLENPLRHANFAVLRAPEIPSILVEMGFLSNPRDEKLLNQRNYQAHLATQMVAAIDRFFEQRSA